MGCQVTIAQSIVDAGADYLLAVKDNQPTLHAEIESYFATAPAAEVEKVETIDKEHGRFEFATTASPIGSIGTRPSAPIRGPRAFHNSRPSPWWRAGSNAAIKSKANGDPTSPPVSSRALSAAAFGVAARDHWAIENKLHWVLDVTFGEDQSRLRTGHGAKNMAVVRHFAINLVRQVADKRSIKRRRKRAAFDPQYLLEILGPLQPKPG
jgi:predicted transposase YbfD/YdcC